MPKYRAKFDTVFNFQVVRAGKIIVAGEELRNSPNFECLDDSAGKTAPASSNTGVQPKSAGTTEYAKALLRAKELGIPKYNRIPQSELLAAIAEAEAKLAAPKADNAGNDNDENDDDDENDTSGDSAGKTGIE